MLNFAKETENMSAVEILNYYRNLYRADPSNTERGIVANAINDALLTIAQIKAEAYKEFAEKLKEKRWDAECRVGYVQVVDVGDIDEVLKEMVGEEE